MQASSEQICAIFGCSTRQLTRWVDEGLPVQHRGGQGRGDESVYDSVEVHRWLLGRATEKARREQPDARLRSLQAQKLEMEIDRDAGQLVPASEVESLWTEAIVAARTELLHLVDRIKAKVDATHRINLDPADIEPLVLEALEKLSRSPQQLDVEDGWYDDDSPAEAGDADEGGSTE